MKSLSLGKFLFLASIIALAASFAHAEDDEKKQEPKIIYKQKTSINFEDRIVEGSGTNPEGVYVVNPPDKQFGSLLKLRPNFHRELMRDSLLLK